MFSPVLLDDAKMGRVPTPRNPGNGRFVARTSWSTTEPTNEAFNPRLDQTYFFRVPKDKRYLVYGSIFTYYKVAVINKYQTESHTNEIVIPTPIEFDIKATDKAIYVGTWRYHRDEFNGVTKAEILDQYAAALAEFRKKFGADAALRKSLAKPVQTVK